MLELGIVQPYEAFYDVPRQKRSALVRQEQYHRQLYGEIDDQGDSEREQEVAEVLFDLANMAAAAATSPPKANGYYEEYDYQEEDHQYTERVRSGARAGPRNRAAHEPTESPRRNGSRNKRKPEAEPSPRQNGKYVKRETQQQQQQLQQQNQLSRFAKRCASHVYIASYIKMQQEQGIPAQLVGMPQQAAMRPMALQAPKQEPMPATDSHAATNTLQPSKQEPPHLPPGALAGALPPLGANPIVGAADWRGPLPPFGPLAGPAPPGMPPLLGPPGFFFPPGAAPFPHGPPHPFAGPNPLSIFGAPPGAPFPLAAAFPGAAALQQLAGADPAMIAATLAQNGVLGHHGTHAASDIAKTEAMISAAMLANAAGVRPFAPAMMPPGRIGAVPNGPA